VPGEPTAEVHGPGARRIVAPPATAEAKATGRQAANQQRARRKMEAAATAPGRKRGIGAAIFNGDDFRAGMWARAAAASQSTPAPAPAPPTEAGDSSAAPI
jgi:hypothetical protein